MKLAIFKVNQLGDNLIFLPIVQEFRRLHPEWELFLYTSPVAAELFSADLAPEQMLVMPTADFNGAWKRPITLGRLLLRSWLQRFDATLIGDDQGNVAHLLARLAGGKLRVGIRPPFIKLAGGLTDPVVLPPGLPIAQANWEIARALVRRLKAGEWAATPPPPNLSHLYQEATAIPGRVVIHSGASLVYKRWFPERFEALANLLARRSEVIWIEQPHTAAAGLSSSVQRLAPKSLGQFVRLLRTASLLVGNNSGPMNIASALGCPSVILSGPSHPVWDPIWHPERSLILRDVALPCLPCDGPVQPVQVCLNRDEPLACMAHWSVEEVARRCTEWLARWASQS